MADGRSAGRETLCCCMYWQIFFFNLKEIQCEKLKNWLLIAFKIWSALLASFLNYIEFVLILPLWKLVPRTFSCLFHLRNFCDSRSLTNKNCFTVNWKKYLSHIMFYVKDPFLYHVIHVSSTLYTFLVQFWGRHEDFIILENSYGPMETWFFWNE